MLHFGIVRDISQLKKTEQALTMTERFYRSVVDLSPDVIAVIDPAARILQVNSRGIELFGIRSSVRAGESSFQEPEEFGSSILDAVVPEFRARLVEDLSTILLYGSIDDSEYRMQGPDGNLFWGSMSARLIPSTEDETSTILLSIRNITRRKHEESNLVHLATIDSLTGLFNRRGFTVAAEQEILHASRRREGMALIFMDMDGLKSINDRFGHSEGDKALCSTAEILRKTFRKSDILGRWGGDEFVALALDVPQGSISLLLDRLEKARASANAGGEGRRGDYELSFSLGMAVFDPTSSQSLEDLIAEADSRMYRAKQEKKRRP
jgi:diguanylate cyclase (GGDEF)-like protein/PAS domain S-box-containing protein